MVEPDNEDQEAQKQAKREIDNAEKKFQNLITKRDELKQEAFMIRDERDSLNKQRKEIVDSIKEMREKRDGYVERIRKHKQRRNDFQKQAKELISAKKTKRQKIYKNIGGEIESTKAEMEYLDMQRQTVPMKLSKENEMLDEIRSKKKNLEHLEKLLPEQEDLSSEVMTIDEKIDQLFKKADTEHAEVVKLSEESNTIFDEIKKKSSEIRHLITQADQKHEEYKDIIERSGHFHERAMEMRDKVMALRRERKEKYRKAKKEIDDQNLKARRALTDEARLDAAADEAVKALLKKGKIEM